MKFAKLQEVTAAYKSLRENGLDKEAALKSLEKSYAKKGMEGDFVLNEDGETVGLADLEFSEVSEKSVGHNGSGSFDAASVKSIADAVTKSIENGFKSFVPATPVDREEESRAGFRNCGEFLTALKSLAGGVSSNKLNAWREKSAPSNSMGESTGESGGVLVPPAFLQQIMQYQELEGVNLLGKVNSIPVSGNSVTIPTNEETPWGGGTQAYWTAEMATIGQTRPKLGNITLTLNDLTVLVPVGNNLLEDASATSTVVSRAIGQTLDWKFNEAIITGGGAGMPQGVLNSGALVTVAKESGQAAGTLVVANLIKMYARLLRKQNGAWFVNPQVFEQILSMVQPGGLLPSAFKSDTGFSQAPLPTIFGLPVVELENCPELGAKGDIILADMNGYAAITKNTQMATSIHMFFDTNATAFRAVARMDGKTWAQKPVVSAKNPDFKRSQFVTLAARQ